MPKNDFTRTNVDVRSLEVSAPGHSSFDLTQNLMTSVPFGTLFPLRGTHVIPSSTLKGSVNPQLQLEKFATPAAGRMRLDTHSFIVSAKRIHNKWMQFIESGQVGADTINLPTFQLYSFANAIFNVFYIDSWRTLESRTFGFLFEDVQAAFPQQILDSTPQTLLKWTLNYISLNLQYLAEHPSDLKSATIGHNQDWFMEEAKRIADVRANAPSDYYLGDFVYDVLKSLFGEGSTMDMLGYQIISYYGTIRERLNKADFDARALVGSAGWTASTLADWIDLFSVATMADVLSIEKFDADDSEQFVSYVDDALVQVYPLQNEMLLRANYAVWFDYFRNYHLDKTVDCLNPNDFGESSICGGNAPSRGINFIFPRKRNWQRDAFTMVQPDDIYRHVYAPASASYDDATVISDAGDGAFNTYFDSVKSALGINGVNPGSSIPFPSSVVNLFTPDAAGGSISDTFNVYYHDLQTMRRAEMLRRKLTRDYYNPDTYYGTIEARYGVRPSDFAIMVSQYIGGAESMINGSQVTANMETDETAVGQRTLVADAGSTDSFSYFVDTDSYLLNYVSIVPIVHYDGLNPYILATGVNDLVIPEFANDNQVMIRTCDLVRDFFQTGFNQGLGYVPRYYGYRTALDVVHGKYLREYRSYTWLRDRVTAGDSMLTKNAINEHINMPLDCFQGLKPWDTVAFGTVDLPLFIDAPLPAKLEVV